MQHGDGEIAPRLNVGVKFHGGLGRRPLTLYPCRESCERQDWAEPLWRDKNLRMPF